MKLFIVSVLTLVSSVAMADGFRCDGVHFRAKMYNEVQPDRGTRTPAVLVVFEKTVGTIASLQTDEIVKTNNQDSVTYEGQSNSRQDGRFVAVRLEVQKRAREHTWFSNAWFEDEHDGQLLVNADGVSREEPVVCTRYLKHGQ